MYQNRYKRLLLLLLLLITKNKNWHICQPIVLIISTSIKTSNIHESSTPLRRISHSVVHVCTEARWRQSMQFRQICLFTLNSIQEIFIPSDSQETSLHTHIFSLEVKKFKILTDFNCSENEAVKTSGHYKSESRALPPPCEGLQYLFRTRKRRNWDSQCFYNDPTWWRTVHGDHYVTGLVPGAGVTAFLC